MLAACVLVQEAGGTYGYGTSIPILLLVGNATLGGGSSAAGTSSAGTDTTTDTSSSSSGTTPTASSSTPTAAPFLLLEDVLLHGPFNHDPARQETVALSFGRTQEIVRMVGAARLFITRLVGARLVYDGWCMTYGWYMTAGV